MRLLAAWTVLAMATPAIMGAADLFCSCRLWRHRDTTLALHCNNDKEGRKGVSCEKAIVPEIPPGYQYVSGYALVKIYRTFKTWSAGKETCEADGGRLAIPLDHYAVDGLKQVFGQEKGVWYAFVGISDEVSEGVFVGVDGRPAPYLNWQPKEPSDHVGKENCVTVRNDGLMNDLPCNWLSPFFCERPLKVGVPDTYRWLESAGRFYRLHADKRSQSQAAHICKSENATLAVTDTWRRGEALLSLFEPSADFYFIGFNDQVVEGDFVTETGRHLDDMEFQVWGPNEPNNNEDGKEEDCMAISGRGYYNDVRCDKELPFICEIAPT